MTGQLLKGEIDGQEIKVVRSHGDEEDLEKAVMMCLLKRLWHSYSDVKKLQSKISREWKPVHGETYY